MSKAMTTLRDRHAPMSALNQAATNLALYHLLSAEQWQRGPVRYAHLRHSLVVIAYAGDREQKRQAVNLMGRLG